MATRPSCSSTRSPTAGRDLADYDVAYLFIDGIAERIRPGQRREPVMAAWGFTFDGCKVLLHLMAGSKEDAETVSAFFQDMRTRGLGDPLLVVSDGAPKLCHMGHLLMENRNGLIVDALVTMATGTAERDAAQAMLARQTGRQP